MEKSKKPVVIVLIVLMFLIIASIGALIVLKQKDNASQSSKDSELSQPREAVVDFELSQLAEKAEQLVNDDLAEALRQGDVPIDFMSALREDLEKADQKLAGGDFDRARRGYAEIIETAESRLETLRFARSARELKDTTYAELGESEYLKTAFENTYTEAVDTYNLGLQNMEVGNYEQSITLFETTGEILEELKEQSVQQLEALQESAQVALSAVDPVAARTSFERILEIDSTNEVAKKGLREVESLEAITAEVQAIKSLQESGEHEAALAKIGDLIAENSESSFLLKERETIEAAIAEDKRVALLKQADVAEVDGDFSAAIAALEAANKIRKEPKTTDRLKQLKIQEKEKKLETLLETGYNSLKAANYNAAKVAYDGALKIDPKSKEAREGLAKTSSMYLASIRYNQSIDSAARYLSEGRIPLATKFFNEALESRPSAVSFEQKDEESRIRKALEAQKEKVSVRLVSDGKTYVSMIGVFAPERFKEKELLLYPDVYTIKGTRNKYLSIETEVKVIDPMRPEGVEVVCTDKL